MARANKQVASTLLETHQAEVLQQWMRRLKEDGALQNGRIRENELQAQCAAFLDRLREALAKGALDVDGADFAGVREVLSDISASRATQGFSPRETAVFVFSLKQPLFDALQKHGNADATAVLEANLQIGLVLDRPAIGSLLVDNLNATIHLRALLTDLFLLDQARQ